MKAYIEQRIAFLRAQASMMRYEFYKGNHDPGVRDNFKMRIKELSIRINELELIDTGSMPDTTTQVNVKYPKTG